MIKRRAGLALTAALAATLPIILLPSPASADVIWQTGANVSDPGFQESWPRAQSIGGSTKCHEQATFDSYAQVKKLDDFVFVKDLCVDGRSAMAQVITYNEAGQAVRHRYCRNPHGKGTVARCNFDWPDNGQAKVLVAGSYNGDTGNLYWDHGNSIYFVD